MSTTLSAARMLVRRKLEDTSGTPLWADALLNDGLKAALDDYSAFRRDEKTSTVTLADGDTSFALPADCRQLVAMIGPDGWRYPMATEGFGRTSDLALSWEVFGSTVYLTAAASAGDYTLWYRADYVFPSSDAATFPIPDSDVGLLVAAAMVYALDERAVQEGKRGPVPPRYQVVLQQARAELAREWDARRRRVRVRTLAGGEGGNP